MTTPVPSQNTNLFAQVIEKMSNPEKMKVDDTVPEEERGESDEQCGDEESATREIVLGLPALRISSERFGVSIVGEEEEEARLNEQAVVAAELVMAAAEEAVMKEKSDGKKKKKKKVGRPRKMMNVHDEAGGSGEGVEAKKKKKKSPAFNQQRGPPVCNICGRAFGSWKGVFGHMRSHKDRNYQGFLPPLKLSQVLGGYTIPGPNSAFVLFTAGGGSSVGVVADGGAGVPGGEVGRGLEIDLNVDPEEEEEQEVTESGTLSKFDLNKPPPKDEEEKDKAK